MSETINGISILSAEKKRPLVADLQWFETYTSAAFNRKLKGIVKPGFYEGFEPVFSGGLTLTISSKSTPDKQGAASINVGEHQISIHQIDDVTFTLPSGATTLVVLEANYQQGVKTDQVDANSGIPAVRLFLVDVNVALKGNQLEVCRVTIPTGTTEITAAMLSTASRLSQTIGVEMSSDIDSDSENIAASLKAVKQGVAAAKAHTDDLVVTKELDLAHNLNALGPSAEGRWSKKTSNGATIENGFPEDDCVGFLDVIAGGQYGGTQCYTSRSGNIYVRSLTANWNGTDGPWSDWCTTQMAARPLTTTLDLNTLGNLRDVGIWRNSTSSLGTYGLNFPCEGAEGRGILEVFEGGRFNVMHRFTNYLGRIFTRSLTANWNGTNGPWSAWVECNDRRGAVAAISLNTYGPDHIGSWSCLNSTFAIAANNYPIEGSAGIGLLEVYSAGNSLMQRFTSRYGRIFTRTLTSPTWNGSNGPWSAWFEVGTANITNIPADAVSMADPRYFFGNVVYTINIPMPDMVEGMAANSAAVLTSYKRNYVVGASLNQYLMMPGGRVFYRSGALEGTNNEWTRIAWSGGDENGWKELLTTDSIGPAFGIGGNTPNKVVDFNVYDFKSGETFYFSPAAAINLPDGLSWGAGINVGCHVLFASDLYYTLILTPTTTAKNEKNYLVKMRGTPGSVRSYAVSVIHDSGNTLDVENGGTGGKTPAEAREKLELNTRIINSDKNINEIGPALEGCWGKATSSGATIENGFPEDNCVGVLDVIAGGQYGGTQCYTSRSGNIYVRSLTANWNGKDGPWGDWRATQMATRPLNTTLDLNTLGNLRDVGIWRNSSSSIGTEANHYPATGADGQGLLEVLEGGFSGRTQRYTTSKGLVFIRSLSAAWNGVDGPWSEWIMVGTTSRPNFYSGDMNLLTTPGIWSITDGSTGTINGPVTPNYGAICEVILRSSANSLIQRWTNIVTGSGIINRIWQRTLSGTTWSDWHEVLTSHSLGLNYGIGQTSLNWDSTAKYDLQQMDFAIGVITHAQFQQFTNLPPLPGVVPAASTRCYLEPLTAYSPASTLLLTIHRGNTLCDIYHILVGGSKGTRTLTVRQVWTSGNTTIAADGTLKAASPVVRIFQDGSFETNTESEGVTVKRLDVGEYLIEGCLGLNADAAWGGIDGGFDIPTDKNKQPLIWLDYSVNKDGTILLKTYHRVHADSPVYAQNRIGMEDKEGNFVETIKNQEPVDIPAYQFVSVRVQMSPALSYELPEVVLEDRDLEVGSEIDGSVSEEPLTEDLNGTAVTDENEGAKSE